MGACTSAMDPDVGATSVTWSLAGDRPATMADFEIDAANGALSFKELARLRNAPTSAPTSRPYNESPCVATVQVDDGDTQTLERTGRLAVTVRRYLDVNEAPTVSGNATPSVDENTTAVATYSATDPDERATITWSVEDPGASDFTITNAGALSFASAPNYEVKSSYTVTVRASDGTNDVPHVVTVTVTDVNEKEELLPLARRPFIGIPYTAAFKAGMGDVVQSPTWAWAALDEPEQPGDGHHRGDGGDVQSGGRRPRPLPARDRLLQRWAWARREDPVRRPQSSSTLPRTSSRTTWTPVFPSPLFAGGEPGLSVRRERDRRNGRRPGASRRPTRTLGTLTYSLAVYRLHHRSALRDQRPPQVRSGSPAGAALDHEDRDHDRYSVTVTAEDEYTATGTATFDITIDDVNEPPVAGADSARTREDMAVTFGVLGNDTDQDDGDTLAVTSTTQPRRGSVVLDTNTQMLTYTPAENDHDTYTFTYRATDGTLSSEPAQVTVTVNAVNDPPEFETEMTTRTVSESAQPGDEVGTKVEATDVDDITLTYRLSGASDFVIDASGPTAGQIRVAPDITLDREHTSSYEVTVTASDRFESDSITVTINVSNVNEAPTAMNDTAMTAEDTEVKIDVLDNDTDPDTEKAALRVSVLTQPLNGTARAQSDQTITYTPNANFAGPNSFTYRVSDGRLTDDGSVSVTVVAVNDAPTFFPTTAARSVPEDAEAGDNVGPPVTATDVEGDTLSYYLSGADASSFEIDSGSGQITVASGTIFNIAMKPTYTVTVTADDGSGEANATATVEVTITVTAGPPIIIITGGGGGGGGPSGPDAERGRLRVDREARHRGAGRRQRPGHRRVVGRHDAVGR